MRNMIICSEGVRTAEDLIVASSLDYTSPWIFTDAEVDEMINAENGIEDFRGICLGEDSAIDDTDQKERYLFPIVKDGKLFRSAVILAKERATQLGYDDVVSRADVLLERIQSTRVKQEDYVDEPDEFRAVEMRAFNAEDGTFEAYIAIWDEVDSFGTRFKRGAFRKTIRERLEKQNIKILWQHDLKEPIGLVTRAVEDTTGLLIYGRLDLGVPRADQARQQMESGTLNQFSFGFDIIRQKRAEDGFMDISEVKWWEASPVTFGANENTSVINVRSLFNKDQLQKTYDEDKSLLDELEIEDTNEPEPEGERADEFDETMRQSELARRGDTIMSSLWRTIEDIWWTGERSGEQLISDLDAAWEKAHAAYVDWVSELVAEGIRAASPYTSTLAVAFSDEFGERTIESIAQDSNMSVEELRKLQKGELLPLNTRERLNDFSENIAEAHRETRTELVINLFNELRALGFMSAEKTRLKALLSVDDSTIDCRCHEGDTSNCRHHGPEPVESQIFDTLDSMTFEDETPDDE